MGQLTELGVTDIAGVAFAVMVAYAALGNAIVCLLLVRRKIPLIFRRAGWLFYLYKQVPPTNRQLRAFALSTNIAALLIIPCALIYFGHVPS